MVAFACVLAGCTEDTPQTELRCGQPGGLVNIGAPGELDELAGCTTLAGSLRVGDTGLVDVDGLERLRVIEGTLNFFRNPDLIDLRGLRNLEVVGDELLVHHNEALASISDLARLRSTGELLISSNRRLTRIGLDRLATVDGDLRIISNSSLRQVDAERFAAGIAVGGVVEVLDNAP